MQQQAHGAVEAGALAEATASALRAEAMEHRTAREELKTANASYRQQYADYCAYLKDLVEQLQKTVSENEALLTQARVERDADKKQLNDLVSQIQRKDVELDDAITQMSQLQVERDGAFERSRKLQERCDSLNTINLDQEVSLRENDKVIKDLGKQLRECEEQIAELNRSNAEAAALSDASGDNVPIETHRRHLHRLENAYIDEKNAIIKIARDNSAHQLAEYDRLFKSYEDQTEHTAVLMSQNASLCTRVEELEQKLADSLLGGEALLSGSVGPTVKGPPAKPVVSQATQELNATLESFVVPDEPSVSAGGSLGPQHPVPGGSLGPQATTVSQAPSPPGVPPARAKKDQDAIAMFEAIEKRNIGCLGDLRQHGVILPGGADSAIPVARLSGGVEPSACCRGPETTAFSFPDATLPKSVQADLPPTSGRIVGWSTTSGEQNPSGSLGPGANSATSPQVQPGHVLTHSEMQYINGQPVMMHYYTSLTDPNRHIKKEADTIGVPGWPGHLQMRMYLVSLQQRLALASAYGDDAEMDWIAAVWSPGMTLAKLQRVESRFISLSRKLSVELYKTCPPKVRMVIDEYNRQLAIKGAMLNGPQTLFLMIQSREFNDHNASARSVADLYALKWMGDKPHEKRLFLHTYFELARSIKHGFVTEEGLRDIIAECLKESKDLAFEYKTYESAAYNSTEHTHRFLIDAIERSIARDEAEA